MKKKLTHLASFLLGLSSLSSCSISEDSHRLATTRHSPPSSQLTASVDRHFDGQTGDWIADAGR